MAIGTTRRDIVVEHAVDGAAAITLTLPHDERFLGVARIVVGGLAARLDLPYESLDDLQLAVESVLSEERYAAGDDVTIEVSIWPLRVDAIERDLEPAGERLGLDVLLRAVVDSIGFENRDGAVRSLMLEKRIPPRA
jgi:anti-sigma regulatory factor (Ser/Thr protein kinase)